LENKYSIVGVVAIIMIIVALSGCTNSSGYPSVKGPYPDIRMANTPTVTLISDGSSYMVGGLIQNSGSKTYTNVKLKISGLDSSGKVVSSKETILANLAPDATADYQVFLNKPSGGEEIIGADLEVVSANES
jgi:hypothetical protein